MLCLTLLTSLAHVIRNRATKQFKAVNRLCASIRWCVTGTVVQNSLDDLSSLVSFLRVPLLADAKSFQRHISGRKKILGALSRPDYGNLKLLLGCICLRRSTYTILFSLGVKFEECRQPLTDAERRAYDSLVVSCERSIKAAVNDRSGKGGGRLILMAIFKLRIFCNIGITSPINPGPSKTELFRPDEVASLLQQSGKDICARCSFELPPNIKDESGDQQMGSNHQMGCGNCGQLLALRDTERTLEDDANTSPTTNSDKQQNVPHAPEVGLSSTMSTTEDDLLYPSKLVALLVDIKKHYSQHKR